MPVQPAFPPVIAGLVLPVSVIGERAAGHGLEPLTVPTPPREGRDPVSHVR